MRRLVCLVLLPSPYLKFMEKIFTLSEVEGVLRGLALDESYTHFNTALARVGEALRLPASAPDSTGMSPAEAAAVGALQERGFAVVVWTPGELGGVSPRRMQDRSIEFGHGMIASGD